jgi:hypothetical protein
MVEKGSLMVGPFRLLDGEHLAATLTRVVFVNNLSHKVLDKVVDFARVREVIRGIVFNSEPVLSPDQ